MLSVENNISTLKVSQPINIINKKNNIFYKNNNVNNNVNNNSEIICNNTFSNNTFSNNTFSNNTFSNNTFSNNTFSNNIYSENNSKNEYKINNNFEDYKLDFNKFDPSKFSPPNDWTIRLKTRLKKYNDTNIYGDENTNNYINYFLDNI